MKITLSVLLITTLAFSYSLWLGRDLLFEGEGMCFEDIEKTVYFVADALEYDEPILTRTSTFTLLQFNKGVVLESEGRMALGNGTPSTSKISVDRFLNFFEIPYTRDGSSLIIPECILKGAKIEGNNLIVEYYGNPAFKYIKEENSLKIVSMGYVMYAGNMYMPEDTILRVKIGKFSFSISRESVGKDIISLEKPGEERKILIVSVGSGMMKPLPLDSFGIIVARGSGIVIVRPMSPDLEGLDKKAFNTALDIARIISRDLGYRIETFPMIDIPPGTPALVILLRDKEDFIKILNIVRRMTGIEKIVNSAPDFDKLPDLGS